MKIALASDHGGFQLKEELKAYLKSELHHDVVDFGTHSTDTVDYPDFAFLAAAAVAEGQVAVGIIVDGAGIGSAIVANKLPGIRAAMCNDLYTARNSRQHNQANVLTMGSQVLGLGLAKQIVKLWLETGFEERHQSRIDKIIRIEKEVYGFGKNK